MKKDFKLLSFILIIAITLISCNQNNNSQNENKSKFAELSGPYLGQKPPERTPELFAPSILSAGGSENKIAFSSDGMEFCYSFYTGGRRKIGPYRKGFMMYSHVKNGRWEDPKEYPFTPDRRARYLFFSPDGKRIYFNSYKDKKVSSKIWYAERQNREYKWSEPKEIDFGEDYRDKSGLGGMYPSVATNGNLYYAMYIDGGNGYIYVSNNLNNKYSKPEKLSDSINDSDAGHPYIAPDESYLIFDRKNDLYISFRDKNGTWIKAQTMGESVNTIYDERRAFVSFDGKYLFFTSNRLNPELPDEALTLKKVQQLANIPENGYQRIYWVDAKIIEELKPKYLK